MLLTHAGGEDKALPRGNLSAPPAPALLDRGVIYGSQLTASGWVRWGAEGWLQGAKPPLSSPTLGGGWGGGGDDRGATGQTSLVDVSQKIHPSITQQKAENAASNRDSERCPHMVYIRGICKDHGEMRWLCMPCKSRSCSVCGPKRRERIALRIDKGVSELSGEFGAGWFIGTWDRDVGKREAGRVLDSFIRWIRRQLRKRVTGRVEYAATWEKQENGRLHVNVILAPWSYISQRRLSIAWRKFGGGPVCYIELVRRDIGSEAAKSSPLAEYLGKLDQMVVEGRGVSYSRGWPKLHDTDKVGRMGEIRWRRLNRSDSEIDDFELDRSACAWKEVYSGEFAREAGEKCDCFSFTRRADPGGRARGFWKLIRSKLRARSSLGAGPGGFYG